MTRRSRRRATAAAAVVAAALAACQGSAEDDPTTEEPALLTTDLPFQYPPDLYRRRVEGDVGLRLFVDSLGLVVPDSTRVEEPSADAGFDSAAVAGAPFLEFRPARINGSRVGRPVVLPVKFRLPPDSTRRDTLPPPR